MQKAEFPVDSRTFPFPHCLAETSAWSKLKNNIEDSQQYFEKKRHLQVLRIKLTLSDKLTEFFISANHECSQIALLEFCAQ